jgi:hypothetical protein
MSGSEERGEGRASGQGGLHARACTGMQPQAAALQAVPGGLAQQAGQRRRQGFVRCGGGGRRRRPSSPRPQLPPRRPGTAEARPGAATTHPASFAGLWNAPQSTHRHLGHARRMYRILLARVRHAGARVHPDGVRPRAPLLQSVLPGDARFSQRAGVDAPLPGWGAARLQRGSRLRRHEGLRCRPRLRRGDRNALAQGRSVVLGLSRAAASRGGAGARPEEGRSDSPSPLSKRYGALGVGVRS